MLNCKPLNFVRRSQLRFCSKLSWNVDCHFVAASYLDKILVGMNVLSEFRLTTTAESQQDSVGIITKISWISFNNFSASLEQFVFSLGISLAILSVDYFRNFSRHSFLESFQKLILQSFFRLQSRDFSTNGSADSFKNFMGPNGRAVNGFSYLVVS